MSTCASLGGDRARPDVEARGGADPVEECGFGGGHPDLTATREPGEQGGAALGIEVSGDLVE
jgi:hypothetical protein